MVPSLILLGLIVGMFPRQWFWYGLGMAVIVSVLFLGALAGPVRTDPERLFVILILTAANIAAGAVIARLVVNLAVLVWSKRRR